MRAMADAVCRLALLASLCVLGWLAGGCESAEHKCTVAREQALSEWNAYVGTLEQARDAALATQRDSSKRLTAEVEPRLFPLAQKRADARYDRSSEAWLRANKTAYHELCSADAQCSALSQKSLEAGAALEDVQERLALARAARDAVQQDIKTAEQAAQAVIIHNEVPQLKQAQAGTRQAIELCKDVKLPEGQALSSRAQP